MEAHESASHMKPSRSESGDLLSGEEREKYAEEVKQFLKKNTPTRPLKPGRSEEISDSVLDEFMPKDWSAAEVARFKKLQADGQVLQMDGGHVNDDNYVETKYYDDLNSVDKSLHHETGSGFIEKGAGGISFTIGADPEKVFKTTYRSNPATNDWEPTSSENMQIEPKVRRSDP